MKLTVHWLRFIIAFVIFLTLFSFDPSLASAQTIDYGKSYINVTKGLNGGTVELGDTLEIRVAIVVRSGGVYDSCAFYDTVQTGTTYIPGTIKVLTNEGKVYKSFTDAAGDDEGGKTGSAIRINLGYNQADKPATAFIRGLIRSTHRPSFYGGSCIMVASFRVKVTSAIGTQINLGGGAITYKNGLSVTKKGFPSNPVAVYTNYGICSNTVGVNALGTEFNGTFGSGKKRYRGASPNVPYDGTSYAYTGFTSNAPNDYFYGIANNTSTNTGYTTSNTWAKPDGSSPTHRVFSVWDIIGDHTGAASPLLGNPAADTVANPNAGYMLVVNAAYRIDSAFQHTISNLCPNTYYEISTWMRNICSKCGCDSTGKGATGGAGYIATAPGDSSGVYPNLTYELNGVDYYTTGNIKYTGQWIKKGFTFLTGPAQTSVTLKLINNAPGGGGNDWALDDITVATCSPNFTFTPTPNPMVCDSNVVSMGAIIKSFFPNYTNYKWQKSINNGATWTDLTAGATGTAVWNGSEYTYTVNYPSFVAYRTDSGTKYKVVVATTFPNLSNSSCQVSDGSTTITLNILNCGITLSTNLISFSGQLQNDKAHLNWTTTAETESLVFEIEKSTDGNNYYPIGSVNSYGNYNSNMNTYSFIDPDPVTGTNFYRIRMFGKNNQSKYSRTVEIAPVTKTLAVMTVINPFTSQLDFYVNAAHGIATEADLFDGFGRRVKNIKCNLLTGSNHLVFNNTQSLPAGAYTLRIKTNDRILSRPVIKLKN
ncbi:MAG: C-terminal target protein [Chitinophagaceae bacterium]|nr:C-terminal target protein [Chitinophagaceae bacterium]